MTWISAAELARQTGVSRAAITKAISTQRIPPDAVRRTGTRLLVERSAGLQGIGHRGATATEGRSRGEAPAPARTAAAGGLFAWGTTAAAPDPDPEPSPAPAADAPPELEQLLAREREWINAYDAFRRWITDGMTLELMRRLPDPAPIGDVMVLSRDLLLERMQQLDTMERRSRFSPEQWRK